MVVEAVSDATQAEALRDTDEKRRDYALAGVKEYTILDPSGLFDCRQGPADGVGDNQNMHFYRLTAAGHCEEIQPEAEDVIRSELLPGFSFGTTICGDSRIWQSWLWTRSIPSMSSPTCRPLSQGFTRPGKGQKRSAPIQKRRLDSRRKNGRRHWKPNWTDCAGKVLERSSKQKIPDSKIRNSPNRLGECLGAHVCLASSRC